MRPEIETGGSLNGGKITQQQFLSFKTLEEAFDASGKLKKENYLPAVDELILSSHQSLLNEITTNTQKKDELLKKTQFLRSALSAKMLMSEYNVQPEYAFDQLLIQAFNP